MTQSSIPVSGLPVNFASPDDEGLFDYIDTLRARVKATVATEQERGQSLSAIVEQVREMVRLSERDADHLNTFSSDVFRAISRQAVAWCVETYQPGK